MISIVKGGHSRSSKRLLFFLIGLDFVLIAASVMRFKTGLADYGNMFSVSEDGGYAEYFQYFKFGIIIFLLSASMKAYKSALIGGWALVFAMLCADDALSIHESLGRNLATWFSIPSMYNLRPEDYGEIAVYVMMGVIVAAILTLCSRIDRSSTARALSKGLLVLLVGLGFFGGLVDMLHIAAKEAFQLSINKNALFAAFEDGGEMIVVSLILWFVYRFYLTVKRSRSLELERAVVPQHQTNSRNRL